MSDEAWNTGDHLADHHAAVSEVHHLRRSRSILIAAVIAGLVVNLTLLAGGFTANRMLRKQQAQNESLLRQLRDSDDHIISLSDDCERLRMENARLRGVAPNAWGKDFGKP